MSRTRVDADNFARAESHRMFADLQRSAGGVNRFAHNRTPASVDDQVVIRMKRDTLYSFAVVDLSAGAAVTLPAAGERYLSVMVVDEDHYINRVLHDPGRHELTVEECGGPHVVVAARILVDPRDPADLAAVAALQDRLEVDAVAARPFVLPDYDPESFDRTRNALLALAADLTSFERSFGRADDVDPVHHLIGAAAGWGGLPDAEATYVGVFPDLPVGEYELTVGDVPVDGFWSISVYDAAGFFQPNASGAYSVNSITAARDPDGGVTVRFGGDGDPARNSLPIPEGWNYLVRLYRPRPEILDGRWTFPAIGASGGARTRG
ncbi:DUF1254 domain-containing protein [Trujillonella endophytica]|uniref:Carboxylesterase n=1 Tax=Trujillonella endophytica TaxID=673521 RepID=A0A1H8R6V4_9ACTN|nr:DUF1254 domain-containing protein [Trujillella endophytica]SEO61653.1 Protein of unknown function [Trujillella endophytica]